MSQNRPASRLDLWTGLGALATGLMLMVLIIPIWVPVFSPPRPVVLAPWMLPQAAAAVLALSGAALAWRARSGGTPPETTLWRGLALGAAGVAAYVTAMDAMGWILTGVAVTAGLVLARKGVRAWPAALLTAGLTGALAWAMFDLLAGTPLPHGPLGF